MKNNKTLKDNLIDWIKSIFFSIIIAVIISNFIIVNAIVPTASMESTINVGDRLIANRLTYIFNKPERGDIVVFNGTDKPNTLFVKRIIGLPGDTIEIANGNITINDILLIDDYTAIIIKGNFGPYTVPEGHYFMLGDNRNNSNDSRYWNDKYVPASNLVGKVLIKYFPKINILK